jgi:hypothetical protein
MNDNPLPLEVVNGPGDTRALTAALARLLLRLALRDLDQGRESGPAPDLSRE